MRIPILFFFVLLWTAAAPAQQSGRPGDPFPSATEFAEARVTLESESFEDAARLARVESGALMDAVGFRQYERRVYADGASARLSVTIVSLADFRAAYSLLTLLRKGAIQSGPPGDLFAAAPGQVLFCQSRKWVRIDGAGIPDARLRAVALHASLRLGSVDAKPPALVARFPKAGFEAETVNYFPGIRAFETHSGKEAVRPFGIDADAEVARARYSVGGRSGTLSLLKFPTPEVAEQYFADFSDAGGAAKGRTQAYVKRAGPVVAVLQGGFDPPSAATILGPLTHTYSVRWIYEKPKKSGSAFGVPVVLLHTVVKSIFFVVLLGVLAVAAGAAAAYVRFRLRRRAVKNSPDGQDRTDYSRLRLR